MIEVRQTARFTVWLDGLRDVRAKARSMFVSAASRWAISAT